MKQTKTFGIIGAMESEVTLLISRLQNAETMRVFDLNFHRGTLGNHTLVIVQSGIGKVSAARCAQILIDRFSPDYLINTGVAGGVGEGLSVGDFVVGTELVQHDFDLSYFGHARGYFPGFGEADDRETAFRADGAVVEAFCRAAAEFLPASRVHRGRIATGDQFIAGKESKRVLRERFGALAAEMEGGAIAQTAQMSGVPFVVVRAISDLADGTAVDSFQTFERETANLSATILERFMHDFS